MRVLLLKPRPGGTQFGLAPFFQTEPLGLEYLSAALERSGHSAQILDLRFDRRSLPEVLGRTRPQVVGVSCLHILDAPATLALGEQVKAFDDSITVVVGGHAASAYPEALTQSESIDIICLGEGEQLMPAVVNALESHMPVEQIPSLLVADAGGGFLPTAGSRESLDLSGVRPPDRSKIAAYQKHYCCLNYMPVWNLETARGCPYRCTFCSVWQFYRRTHRFHSPDTVRDDFAAAGHNVFVVDDIFWAEPAQSQELAAALLASGVRKNWILAQSRCDLVAQGADLLERWRPLARSFDIFFGFESPTRDGLASLNKGADIAQTGEAIRVARKLGYGITGNFIIDPDYTEDDFKELWSFLDQHRIYRAGFTILTPLPGTYFFEQVRSRLRVLDWNHYDLHHLLWPPRLPLERFFELYCETWRRSVLNLGGRKKWWRWWREVEIRQLPRLLRILGRTQKLMDPKAYLGEAKVCARQD